MVIVLLENLTMWAISDFGFKMVPIYRADILEYTNESIRISPLKCYVKGKNSTTILTPCNKAGKYTEDVLNIDIEDYLSSTEFLKWEWRKKKLASSNDRKPIWEILDMPDLAENKKISLLSLKQRENEEYEKKRRIRGSTKKNGMGTQSRKNITYTFGKNKIYLCTIRTNGKKKRKNGRSF